MEFAAGLPGLGRAPDRRRRAHRRATAPAAGPVPRSRSAGRVARRASATSAGCSPRHAHAGDRRSRVTSRTRHARQPPGRTPSPLLPLASLERRTEGLVCLSGCARDGALAGVFGSAASLAPRPRRWRGGCCGAFGPDALPGRAAAPALAPRPWRATAGSRARRAARRAVRRDRQRPRPRSARGRALQDALVASGWAATLDETEPLRRGNRALGARARRPRWRRASRDHPEAVAETARLAERLRFDLTRDLGYRYPGAEDDDADRELAELCAARFEGRYAGTPERARGGAAAGGGAAGDPQAAALRASSCSTPTCSSWRARWRVEVRGPDSARGAAAAGARARLQRQLGRLLPDRASRTSTRSRPGSSSAAS